MIVICGPNVELTNQVSGTLHLGAAFPGPVLQAAELNVVTAGGLRLIHFKYEAGVILVASETPHGFAPEGITAGVVFRTGALNVLEFKARSASSGPTRRIEVLFNEASLGELEVAADEPLARVASNFPDTSVAEFDRGSDQLWRFVAKSMGAPAPAPSAKRSPQALTPGLTAVIPARDAEAQIEACIEALLDSVDEVLVIDNASRDDTRRVAEAVQQRHKTVRVLSYPLVLAQPGAQHAAAVADRAANTRGRFMNWALAQVRTSNVLMWEPSFLARPDALAQALSEHDVLTRTDPFALRLGGVGAHGGRTGEGYRCFSKAWGAAWVDGPSGEEMDEAWLLRTPRLSADAPVFTDGGGSSGAAEPVRLEAGAAPRLRSFSSAWTGPLTPGAAGAAQWGVVCVSHEAAVRARAVIRRTWAADFARLGVHVYFVVGDRSVDRPRLHGDVLRLPVRDSYEHLPEKIAAALGYMHAAGYDHVVKVDDDCLLTATTLLQRDLGAHAYCGGQFNEAKDFRVDWHAGKCANDQLDARFARLDGLRAWFAGGAGYAVDRRAMAIVTAQSHRMKNELLEDVAIGRLLEEGGLGARREAKLLRSMHLTRFDEQPWEVAPVDVVWDVPPESLERVYERLSQAPWFRLSPAVTSLRSSGSAQADSEGR